MRSFANRVAVAVGDIARTLAETIIDWTGEPAGACVTRTPIEARAGDVAVPPHDAQACDLACEYLVRVTRSKRGTCVPARAYTGSTASG